MVWGNIKSVDLDNLCPDTIDEAQDFAESGLTRVGSNYELGFAFLAHTGPHGPFFMTTTHRMTKTASMRQAGGARVPSASTSRGRSATRSVLDRTLR